MSAVAFEPIEALFCGKSSAVARDLKLNLKRLLEDSTLAPEEALLSLLALATSVEFAALSGEARRQLQAAGIAADQIQEAAECAAIMGMLNVYYRFRHMLGKDDDYSTTGLRMTALAKPAMGKERFEMLAFALSVLNGCENCIRSHEKVLRDAQLSADKIHDLARLASVVRGFKVLSLT